MGRKRQRRRLMKAVMPVAMALLSSVSMFYLIAAGFDIREAENAWFAVFCSIFSGAFAAAFTAFALNTEGAYVF